MSNEGKPSAEVAAPRQFAILAIALLVSLTGLLGTGLALSLGPFPTDGRLYATYFAYSLFVLIFLHSAVFTWRDILSSRGRALSRNLPRYLEYGYAALISVGLAQVLFMSSQFADYITLTIGDESQLVSRISRQASLHLKEDCPKGGKFFPVTYCEKLQKIVDAKSPEQYITSIVILDDEFLNHTIRIEMHPVHPGGVMQVYVRSPIALDANAIKARREYSTSHQPTTNSRAFSWIAILLLPIGIGIRVLKTSVELFGNLE